MLQQYLPLIFCFFISVSCSSSFAVWCLRTRGTTTGSAWNWAIPAKRNGDESGETVSVTNEIGPEYMTRELFLSSLLAGVGVPQLAASAMDPIEKNGSDTAFEATRPTARVLSIPLRSLPVSGCWAATITVSTNMESDDNNDCFSYLAVVDTGSPFLTAPMGALSKTLAAEHGQGASNRSYEQYGTTIGSVQWRTAPYVTLIGNGNIDIVPRRDNRNNSRNNIHSVDGGVSRPDNGMDLVETDIEPIIIQDQSNVVLGIPSDEVIAETGGIFLGLMRVDAARPTPLQQLGYDAFVMRFREDEIARNNQRQSKSKETIHSDPQATLALWSGNQYNNNNNNNNKNYQIASPSLIDRFDPYSMKLFDLTPFGPDLHHYGVLCDRFECWWDGNEGFNAVSFHCNVQNDTNTCTSQVPEMTLSRPLVAVFDTGLSGCILSDTLWEEIQQERRRRIQHGTNAKQDTFAPTGKHHINNRIDTADGKESNVEESPPIGCTVTLPTIGGTQLSSSARNSSQSTLTRPSVVKLSSTSKYWRFQSFRLPWWYDNKDLTKNDGRVKSSRYPHVVVLGSTFWRNPNILELAVDTTSQRAKIKTVAKQTMR